MRLLRQIADDVLQEIWWIALYGVAMAVALVPLGFVYPNLVRALEEVRALSPYELDKTVLLRTDSLLEEGRSRGVAQGGLAGRSDPESFHALLSRLFSEDGCAGACIIADGTGEFEQTIVFLGAYSEVVPLERGAGPLTLYVSRDVAENHEDGTVEVAGERRGFEALPDDFCFYRLGYMMFGQSTWDFSRTLVVCSYNLDAVTNVLGWPEGEGDLELLDGALCVGATEGDLAELREAAYGEGLYVGAFRARGVLEGSSGSGAGLYVAYLLLFGLAGAGLLGVTLVNVRALLRSQLPVYAVCRLFGATLAESLLRMVLLALSFQVIPLVVLLAVGDALPADGLRIVVLALVAAAVCSVAVAVSVYRDLAGAVANGRAGGRG